MAVNTYFEAPERVAALILVAPAILAPLTSRREAVKGNNQVREESSSRESPWNQLARFCSPLFEFSVFVYRALTQAVKGIVGIVNSLYKDFLKYFLRSAFGVALVSFCLQNSLRLGPLCVMYNKLFHFLR